MKSRTFLQNTYQNYFNDTNGGANLLNSLRNIPEQPLEILALAIKSLPSNGRVFFFGNGGSFDNARFFALTLQKAGVKAFVPGIEGGYSDIAVQKGYAEIYRQSLKFSSLQAEDIAVGISGSGNSENVNLALEYAQQQGAKTFCFGGRDGGKMAQICGDENSIIVPNDCMEAIEDLHLACSLLLSALLGGKSNLSALKENLATKTALFLDKNIETSLPHLAQSIMKTVDEGSRLFVIGHTTGANHFRADMMRGATAKVPIRGINAPELFSVNSFQATANDDGVDYTLVRGLLKHTPTDNDFCLLFSLPKAEKITDLCENELRSLDHSFMKVGCFDASENAIDISGFMDIEFDFGISILGHSTSVAINSWLNKLWDVQPIEINLPMEFQGRKKLNKQEILDLEKRLKAENVLKEDRILSFCYGKTFSIKIPAGSKIERFFY